LLLLEWWVLPKFCVKVSACTHLHEFSWCRFWNKDEWSVNEESELRVQSLSFNLWCSININNIPLLVDSFVLLPYDNVLTFIILARKDIKGLVVDSIQNLSSHEFPDLVPVVCGLCSLRLKLLTSTFVWDSN
jgi:hypothetical protein